MTVLQRNLLLIIICASVSSAQTFSQFVTRVNIAPPEQREALVDSFLNAIGKCPYIENDTLVHFLYYGNATSVTVPGDANNWNANAFPMWKLSTTKLWYLNKTFEADARLDYKFVVNGTNWLLDPRNPHQVTGGFGPNSELRMPKYIPPPEIEYDANIPHGVVKDSTVYSAHLKNSRRMKIYLPPGYAGTDKTFPMILVHDGPDYVSLAKMNIVVDNLIHQRRIEPVIIFFVPPVDRTDEYAGAKQELFTDFIIKELMPHLEAHYPVDRNPARRLVMGASNGGNISLFLALYNSDMFGNVAAQSSYIQPSIDAAFRNSEKIELKLYLDLGTYDIPVLIPLVRNFIPVLQQKGYEFKYQEFHDGHSWGNWRAHLDDILEYFFPQGGQNVQGRSHQPTLFELGQNYPNPFNSSTIIPFSLRRDGLVHLQIFDALGREVATLLEQPLPAGSHWVSFHPHDSASGMFFYRLSSKEQWDSRQMFFIK